MTSKQSLHQFGASTLQTLSPVSPSYPEDEGSDEWDATALQTPAISPAHLKEWTEGSGVSEAIARLNIQSLTAEEMNAFIKPGKPIQTGGWWCRGVNWRTGLPMGDMFGQGKPDKPHDRGKGKKPAKYMTATGMEPDGIFLAMPDKDYWLNVWGDKKQAVLITEGAKKAGAGLSLGLPTIALTGVWNWGKDGAIAPDLAKWAEPGREFIVALDSDYTEKPGCCAAIRKLVAALEEKGCKVRIAVWEEHKGMDDFIVAEGGDAFRQVVASAETLKKWEKQFAKKSEEGKPQKPVPPQSPSFLAEIIAETYRETLAWNIEVREWYRYEGSQAGIWEREPKEIIEGVVRAELNTLVPDGYSHRQLTDIINLLKSDLAVKKWNQHQDGIPLLNGVLNKKTKKLSPHSPGYRLTHCLPFAYDPKAECQPIVEWLRETVGHQEDLVNFLLAYLNAVVNQRADLQRYLELIGPGGTGKSTFMKLASYLVGERNVHTTSHQLLETSRFETANLAGKLLTLVTESDQYVGGVNVLKAITGQDPLHYEQKMKQAGEGFIYGGMVITAGNEPSRSADYTSGLARRKIAVWFKNFIPSHKRRDLDSEFKQYLPGLLNLVLSIPDDEVTDLIRNAEKRCPLLLQFQREVACETNPMADWLDRKVVVAPGNRHTPQYLYNAFRGDCEAQGMQKPISQKRFSLLLEDLCRVQYGWDVKKGRDRDGRYVLGLALRPDGDFSSPFSVTESLDSRADCDGLVTGCDGLVTAETTAVNGCDGCDGFLEVLLTEENFSEPIEQEISPVNSVENTPQPVTPVTQPVTEPVTPSPSEPAKPVTDLQPGEAFRYTGDAKSYKKYLGTVLTVKRVVRHTSGLATIYANETPDAFSADERYIERVTGWVQPHLG